MNLPTFALRGRSYPAALFAVFFALLLTWTIATPLFASPDEPAHLYKAYGTAHGEMLGDPIPDVTPNIRRFDVPAEMGLPNVMCYFFIADVPAGCATGVYDAGVSTAAVYPPFWYAVVGGTARVIDPTSQRVYRAVAGALCAALITIAFLLARRSPAAGLSPLLLIALTPMTLFLAATVNPNGFEVAAFLVMWMLYLHVADRRAASWLGGVVVGGLIAVVLLSRFASAIWVAAAAVVVAILLGRAGLRRFANRRFLVPALTGVLGSVVALLAWSRYAGVRAEDDRIASDWGRSKVFTYTVEKLPEFTRQMIGVLGWLDTRMPRVTYATFALITLVVVAGVASSRDRRLQIATGAVFVGLAAAPVAVNVISARSAGLIWQGRYSLPLFAGLGVLGMLGWHQTIARSGPRRLPAIRIGVSAAFVIAEVAGFWQTLRRFTVGANGKIWLDEPLDWQPAVSPLALITVNAILVTAFVAVVLLGTAPESGNDAPVIAVGDENEPIGPPVSGTAPTMSTDR